MKEVRIYLCYVFVGHLCSEKNGEKIQQLSKRFLEKNNCKSITNRQKEEQLDQYE